MQISVDNLAVAINQYIEQELIPMASGMQKLLLYMTISVLPIKLVNLIDQYRSGIEMFDGFTANNMLNVDTLYPKIKDALHKVGKINLLGILFDENDLDKLYSKIVPLSQN